MTFQKGVSGNPAGREPGSRNRRTIAAEEKLFARADELVDDLVNRALAGEPAAMRLCAERVLPVHGRPLPIDLPPIRHLDDAQTAAKTIVTALKEGALSAREAVDLLRVVEGLTRLTGTVGICKKIARREVARAAQTLGFEHFFAGPPAEHWKKKQDTRRRPGPGGSTATTRTRRRRTMPMRYRRKRAKTLKTTGRISRPNKGLVCRGLLIPARRRAHGWPVTLRCEPTKSASLEGRRPRSRSRWPIILRGPRFARAPQDDGQRQARGAVIRRHEKRRITRLRR